MQYISEIQDCMKIQNRRLVAVIAMTDVEVKIGAPIVLLSPDRALNKTKVLGFEQVIFSKGKPTQMYITLDKIDTKSVVPKGTKLWLLDE